MEGGQSDAECLDVLGQWPRFGVFLSPRAGDLSLGGGGALGPPVPLPVTPPRPRGGVGRVCLSVSSLFGIADWQERGTRRQLVGQAEILPVILAQELWSQFLGDRRVIVFVDNDAARHALIRGASPSGPSAILVSLFWANEASLGSFCWVERVPTQSNPADGPSRLRFDLVRQFGAMIHEESEVLRLPCVGRLALGHGCGPPQ